MTMHSQQHLGHIVQQCMASQVAGNDIIRMLQADVETLATANTAIWRLYYEMCQSVEQIRVENMRLMTVVEDLTTQLQSARVGLEAGTDTLAQQDDTEFGGLPWTEEELELLDKDILFALL